MKTLIISLLILPLIGGNAWALAKKPAKEGTTVNVYTNNATVTSEAYWACRNANFKKASTLDASGTIIPGTTDYVKFEELNKACGAAI